MRTALALLMLLVLPTFAHAQVGWINEFHYDNAGADTTEFVEIALLASLAPQRASFAVHLYNGSASQRKTYAVHGLDTFISADTAGAYLLLHKPLQGLQNGGPDGLALCQDSTVVEFITYEGTFVPVDGCAAGVEGADVGVAESNETEAHQALARHGTASAIPHPTDFKWQVGLATPGRLNPDQHLAPPTCPRPSLRQATIQDATRTLHITLDAGPGAALSAVHFMTPSLSSATPLVPISSDGPFHPVPETGCTGPCAGRWWPDALTSSTSFTLGTLSTVQADTFAYALRVQNTCGQTASLQGDGHFTPVSGTSVTPANVPAATLQLQPAYPNPFNTATTLHVEIPAPTSFRLGIYDILGRKVKTLAEGTHPAGTRVFSWDGTDAHGRPSPSGLYLIRLDAGRQSLTHRLTLLK
ncbi:MAG: FlgD immunoglobulin-like domain containing protein [Bacteroidota bacterium]